MFAENNFYLRRDELRSRCNEFPYDNKIDLSRMVYDDRHKVIMCVVPKVSSGRGFSNFLRTTFKNLQHRLDILKL